ncbi:MAG: YicC family protein [Victivallaceae bacterium]|nr:YicC family protein [Victivallaceae bacterium]
MRSMTGFGKGYAADAEVGIAFGVEISSLNRKQLEIRAMLPGGISALELLLRQLIKAKITRGAVTARVTMTLEENRSFSPVKINRPLLERLAKECAELQRRFDSRASWSVAELLPLPGVLEPLSPDLETAEIKALFVRAAEAALDSLVAMREAEGRELAEDLRTRSARLRALAGELTPVIEKVPALLKQKLLERLEKEELPVDVNDERLLKELIFYVDRADVTEEFTRLRSHFTQFGQFLTEPDAAVGRSLDFLVQEMFREITTLGNKAAGCEVTPVIVEFKTELEKIREQIQNVE